jgi:hypothetical protein
MAHWLLQAVSVTLYLCGARRRRSPDKKQVVCFHSTDLWQLAPPHAQQLQIEKMLAWFVAASRCVALDRAPNTAGAASGTGCTSLPGMGTAPFLPPSPSAA